MSGVALIDYGAGNLQSVFNALSAAGASDIAVTADPAEVLAGKRIVLDLPDGYLDEGEPDV